MRSFSHQRARAGLAIAFAVLGLFCISRLAVAGPISYSLTLCEDLDVLKNPNNMTVAMNAAWKSQPTLLLERSMPYIQLDNTSTVDMSIMQFTLTIGDASKNFDWAKLIQTSPGVTFSLQSPDAIAGGIHSDSLVINFTGFSPGKFVRFQVDLKPDNPSSSLLIDYRNVLFQMNGHDDSNNAIATIAFHGPDQDKTLTKQLPDFSFAKPTASSLAFPSGYGMDHVGPFTLVDPGDRTPSSPPPPPPPPPPPGTSVPEPGSVVLWGLGMLGFTLWGWRQRSRRA